MTYSVPDVPGESPAKSDLGEASNVWPMWEIFVRQTRGLAHVHVGSLHAADAETALQNARDVYTRRQEGVSLWAVPSVEIVASDPDETDSLFEVNTKPYRDATAYNIPDEVGHM